MARHYCGWKRAPAKEQWWAQSEGDARRELNLLQSVGGGVGYGGGAFSVRNGVLLFAARDGRIYRRSLGQSQPRAITPPLWASGLPCSLAGMNVG